MYLFMLSSSIDANYLINPLSYVNWIWSDDRPFGLTILIATYHSTSSNNVKTLLNLVTTSVSAAINLMENFVFFAMV